MLICLVGVGLQEGNGENQSDVDDDDGHLEEASIYLVHNKASCFLMLIGNLVLWKQRSSWMHIAKRPKFCTPDFILACCMRLLSLK